MRRHHRPSIYLVGILKSIAGVDLDRWGKQGESSRVVAVCHWCLRVVGEGRVNTDRANPMRIPYFFRKADVC